MANEEHLARLKQGVEAWNQWRQTHQEIRPDLSGADLSNLDLSGANLSNTDLSASGLIGANLREVLLQGANLHEALMGNTIVGSTSLRHVMGLEAIQHLGPSIIGIETIYRSQGRIPEVFLRGAGVPEKFIQYITSLEGRGLLYNPSCFISYSSHDQAFAERLYADLQSNEVRCWFAPEDMKIGAKIRSSIDASIRLHDKLLLVLSSASVASQWVEQEVEKALERERKEQREVLFPLRLDQAVMRIEDGWPAFIRNTRNIGDFTRWKDHDAYQQAFTRLLRDLKAESR